MEGKKEKTEKKLERESVCLFLQKKRMSSQEIKAPEITTTTNTSSINEVPSNVHPHYHLFNGKRRCLTPRIPLDHHQELRHARHQSRQERVRSGTELSDHRTLHIGIVFHMITCDRRKNQSDVMPLIHDILKMMNGCFGHSKSPLHDLNWIESGDLLQIPGHREIFEQYTRLATAANIQFLVARTPTLHYIPAQHQHTGSDQTDMDYWDRLLKVEISPAINPKQWYNIWVVMDVKSVLLGYGNFPKVNPTTEDIALDGFVYFISGAPYNLHVTAVHESGHVWGLNHPFNHDEVTNEYDDGIDDTPYQAVPDFGPVWFQKGSWPHSLWKGTKHYHGLPNYMDYVDDNCMFMFTAGQVQKMRETALSVRSSWNLTENQVLFLQNGGTSPSHTFSTRRFQGEHEGEEQEDKEIVPHTIWIGDPLANARRKANPLRPSNNTPLSRFSQILSLLSSSCCQWGS